MVNRHLATNDTGIVGKNWLANVAKRKLEIQKSLIKQKYKNSELEYSETIVMCFIFVRNVVAK